MRIIAGKYKRKKIKHITLSSVRPTTDRAKEGLFNILENRYNFNSKSVLDLFSGTGSISFEFLSRGCNESIAIDSNQKCIHHINKINKELNLNIMAVKNDALQYIKLCDIKFDFIFMDPPYIYSYYHEVINLILNKNLIKKNGALIIEHDSSNSFDEIPNIEKRKYGNVYFSILSF